MIKNAYTQLFDIKVDEVGFDKKIFPKKIMEFFQIVATKSAQELGFGFNVIRSKNLAWTINKVKVEILADIGVGNYTFTTWPLSPKHFTCDRDFFVSDENGKRVLQGTTTWNLLDLSKRALYPAKDLEALAIEYAQERALEDLSYQRVAFGDDYKFVYSHEVLISDLDINDHVNNTHYINFAINCLDKREYLKGIACFEIKFQRELLFGDKVDMYLKREDNKRLVIGKRGEEVVFSVCIYLKNA